MNNRGTAITCTPAATSAVVDLSLADQFFVDVAH